MKKILGLVGLLGALSLNSCSENKKDKILAECQVGNLRIVGEHHINQGTFFNDDYYTLKFFETELNMDRNAEEYYVGQVRLQQGLSLKGVFVCDPPNQGKRMVIDMPLNGIYRVYVNKNQ